jgi:transposase
MSAPFKSSPIEFNQHLLFPSNIFDLLSDGHECYLFADLFQQIDTTTIESSYSVNPYLTPPPKFTQIQAERLV